MPDPTPGQVAYEKWVLLLARPNHRKLPWERLRPPVRARWETVAAAVLEAGRG